MPKRISARKIIKKISDNSKTIAMDKIDLLEPIIKILKPYKAKGLHISSIIKELKDTDMFIGNMPDEYIKNLAKELMDEHVKLGGEFDRVKKPNGGVKSGYYKIRRKPAGRTDPQPYSQNPSIVQQIDVPDENRKKNTNFFGKAGEYAVMSELLFQEYNANNMTVDEGIDIIASKNNNFYFIQVKTMTLREDRRAGTKIAQKNFDKFITQQMRYVVAVKCANEMRFFTLTNEAIELLLHKQAIGRNKDGSLSIKIKYEDGKVYFYDDKEEEASFWEGVKIELKSL